MRMYVRGTVSDTRAIFRINRGLFLARWQLSIVKRSRPNLQICARYYSRGMRGMRQVKKRGKQLDNADVV